MSKPSNSQIYEWQERVRTYLAQFGSHAGQVKEAWRAEMIAQNLGILPKRRPKNKPLSSEQCKVLGKIFTHCVFDELESRHDDTK